MRNGKLQVGIVGVGGIGRDQHLPAWAKVSFAEVRAAADVSEQALERAAHEFAIPQHFTDWHDLVTLPELDIVDICTPNRTHTPIALAALSQGKHVLCEKPLATTVDEVCALQDSARRAGRLLMTGQQLRFEPASRQLKGLIDQGMLGEIYYVRAQWLRRRLVPPRPTFIEKRLSGGGPVFDLGVHILDLAYWLLGAPEPTTVSAFADAKLAHRPDLGGAWGDWDHERIDVEDFAVAFVRFATGTTLTLETSWLAFQPDHELVRLQLYGSRGGALWPDGLICGETNRAPWSLRLEEMPKVSGHHEEILQFALAARDHLPSPVPVEETLQVVRILEGVYASARSGREVVLPPVTKDVGHEAAHTPQRTVMG